MKVIRTKYEMNSIKTNKGNKGKGQPAGTNRENNKKNIYIHWTISLNT